MSNRPPREQWIAKGVAFLQMPSVANASQATKIAFLETKGMTSAEIDEAIRRVQTMTGGNNNNNNNNNNNTTSTSTTPNNTTWNNRNTNTTNTTTHKQTFVPPTYHPQPRAYPSTTTTPYIYNPPSQPLNVNTNTNNISPQTNQVGLIDDQQPIDQGTSWSGLAVLAVGAIGLWYAGKEYLLPWLNPEQETPQQQRLALPPPPQQSSSNGMVRFPLPDLDNNGEEDRVETLAQQISQLQSQISDLTASVKAIQQMQQHPIHQQNTSQQLSSEDIASHVSNSIHLKKQDDILNSTRQMKMELASLAQSINQMTPKSQNHYSSPSPSYHQYDNNNSNNNSNNTPSPSNQSQSQNQFKMAELENITLASLTSVDSETEEPKLPSKPANGIGNIPSWQFSASKPNPNTNEDVSTEQPEPLVKQKTMPPTTKPSMTPSMTMTQPSSSSSPSLASLTSPNTNTRIPSWQKRGTHAGRIGKKLNKSQSMSSIEPEES